MMNLVLLDKDDFLDVNHAVLKNRRFDHLIKVNNIEEGDTIRCGFINANMGTGIITRIGIDQCHVKTILSDSPPSPLQLKLVLALPRPKMMRRIIQSVTSLGVKDIYLINSWRVEKSFWNSPFLEPENLRHQMILGLEQSKDTILPTIHIKRFFKKFVEDELPMMLKTDTGIVAHPGMAKACPIALDSPVVLFVGPEGGFIEYEIESLVAQGVKACHIGDRILRVETAVPYLISRLAPAM